MSDEEKSAVREHVRKVLLRLKTRIKEDDDRDRLDR